MGHQTTRVWWAQTLALWALRGGLELPLQIRGQRPPTPLPPTCLLRPAASQGPDLSLARGLGAESAWSRRTRASRWRDHVTTVGIHFL